MKRSGYADLPLHNGQVPKWLFERMSELGLAITEAIIEDYGRKEFLKKMSDPFWFQSFGAVMGMDWHSSGITTSVLGALKRSINPLSSELGIYICGGKGKFSRQAPSELLSVADRTGLDGQSLVQHSKLSAKVDNTAVQDGFQLYLHNFLVSREGDWTVVQQGMRTEDSLARRYHWHSADLHSFVEEPHSAVCGQNFGAILNLTDQEAATAREGILEVVHQDPGHMIREIQELIMPGHHDVRAEDVDLKKLGAMLWVAHEKAPQDFASLLMVEGMGPRTVQSLALVSEVIHGTPTRFRDPARFSFAHGGKDGHPFPVPVNTYDQVIKTLQKAVSRAKLGIQGEKEALKKLHEISVEAEKSFEPANRLQELIEKEREESWKYGGRTIFGPARPVKRAKGVQLRLF